MSDKAIYSVDTVETITDNDKIYVNTGDNIKQIKRSDLFIDINSNLSNLGNIYVSRTYTTSSYKGYVPFAKFPRKTGGSVYIDLKGTIVGSTKAVAETFDIILNRVAGGTTITIGGTLSNKSDTVNIVGYDDGTDVTLYLYAKDNYKTLNVLVSRVTYLSTLYDSYYLTEDNTTEPTGTKVFDMNENINITKLDEVVDIVDGANTIIIAKTLSNGYTYRLVATKDGQIRYDEIDTGGNLNVLWTK